MNEKKVIISGGGTAGHLYPGLAISKRLKEREPGIQITFVGSKRELEKQIMEHHKARIIPLKIEGLKGKGLKIIKSLLLLPYSFLKSLIILTRNKPNLVIGVGGYSSGPIVLLSALMKIPTLILEQNVLPGFTNRLLLPWVRKAVVAFEESLPYFKQKGVFIGNPVREEFYHLPKKSRNSKLTLLIFGGSQGSHFLNQAIVDVLPFLKKNREKLRVFHQTGKKDYEWIKNNYIQNGLEDTVVASYFFDIANYFKRSDLIICRAGATTIAELIASQKASLLIPFSQATDNHQFINARELEKIKATEIIREEDLSPALFSNKIIHFMTNKEILNRMEENLNSLKTENVADKISDLCFDLIGRSHQEERS